MHVFDNEKRLRESYGNDLVDIAEEIVHKAGTSDTHWSVLMAAAELIRSSRLSWWRKDRDGWPIETIKGRRLGSALRIVLQNVRKVTG